MSEQQCRYCRGRLELRRVSRMQEIDGGWIIIENLPAWVCVQCGERYYTPEAHDLVVDLLTEQPTPSRTETIAVYNAEGAA